MVLWGISVRNTKSHEIIHFPVRENESREANFKRVKEYYFKLKKKNPNCTVELISRNQAFPPKTETKPKRGYMYCPYCRKERRFIRNEELDVKNCIICNMSDSDYWVRKFNHLFEKPKRRK